MAGGFSFGRTRKTQGASALDHHLGNRFGCNRSSVRSLPLFCFPFRATSDDNNSNNNNYENNNKFDSNANGLQLVLALICRPSCRPFIAASLNCSRATAQGTRFLLPSLSLFAFFFFFFFFFFFSSPSPPVGFFILSYGS